MAAPKNPVGAKSDKLWRDAVMRAVHRVADGEKQTKRLEKLADKLVEQGLTGDMAAIKEIGDRIDGRPSQAVDMTVTKEVPDLTTHELLTALAAHGIAGSQGSASESSEVH